MSQFSSRATAVAAFIATAALAAIPQIPAARAQAPHSGGLLDNLFGGGRAQGGNSAQVAQLSESDLVVRLDRLENQVRQLTGAIEQLQYRNQQLEQALQQLRGGAPVQQSSGALPPPVAPAVPRQQALPAPAPMAPSAEPVTASHGHSDAFDPNLHPNAPGAPRPLGGGAMIVAPEPGVGSQAPPVGIPDRVEPGAPLDLSTAVRPGASIAPLAAPNSPVPSSVQAPANFQGGALPPPPPRNPSATGGMAAVQPPSHSARDEYDLAFGYMLHKDYALAENAFRSFLQQHPDDRLAADATYWLGESLYQRQRYHDAAESFLAVTTKHEKSSKAPDALFRLGQSLAALGAKEAACAALSEVGRKYPHASAGVKQGVSREQKRVHC